MTNHTEPLPPKTFLTPPIEIAAPIDRPRVIYKASVMVFRTWKRQRIASKISSAWRSGGVSKSIAQRDKHTCVIHIKKPGPPVKRDTGALEYQIPPRSTHANPKPLAASDNRAGKRKTPRSRAKRMLKGTGSLLDEIPLLSIHANPEISVTQENLMTLTSYNLLGKREHTIIVPGSPSIWTPKTLPVNIRPDSGRFIMDPGRYVFPKCPLEPLFRALFTMRPDFNLKDIDLITDRVNLRLLLNFVGGRGQEFRIDVEVVGSTLLFSRWTNRPTCYVDSASFGGYGHGFEKAFTRPHRTVKGSISHNRAISYTLGGVRVVMRFEVDAYIEGALPTSTTASSKQGTYKKPSNALMKRNNTSKTPTGFSVSIRGQFVAPSRIVEIKTSGQGNSVLSRSRAQLWFSQTPILCAGYYAERHVFKSVMETDMVQNKMLVVWERNNTEKLRKLVRAIEMISEVAKRVPGGKCSIIHTKGSGVLKVHQTSTSGDCHGLPKDILRKLNA